jgi:hypothetical protein
MGRVACGDGVNLVVKFQLERGGDGTKCCRKMKWREPARCCSTSKYF